MKFSSKILLIGLLICCALLSACTTKVANIEKMQETEMDSPELRHVVLFKFKADADPVAIKKAEDAFAALPSKIPEIKGFEWGLNNSPEGLNKGLTHCYFLTFKSEADRAIYLPHPDHKAFGGLLGDILEDVVVVDYWSK